MKGDFSKVTFNGEKHYRSVRLQQGRVQLDADWNEHVEIQEHLRQTEAIDVIGPAGVPKSGGGFAITAQALADGLTYALNIAPGRIYVDGILCELKAPGTTYASQLDFPNPPVLNLPAGNFRTDLVYLDVWQRHITPIEDPDILEVALGGPDTTTRVKTVWQVRVLTDVGSVTDCQAPIAGWPPAAGGGLLTTDVVVTPPGSDPCLVVPAGGFRGLENQLYRVEIHGAGNLGPGAGAATFKWSRDNGSVAFRVTEFVIGEPTKIRLASLGHDQVLGLRPGDWVEVLGDETEVKGLPGTLAQIVPNGLDEGERILTLSADVSGHAQEGHPKVRRWDQPTGAVPLTGDPMALENGVQVHFGGAGFKSGDYWVFAARTATGGVETLTAASQQGIVHHYCRLALIGWERVGAVFNVTVTDCRPDFPPLTDIQAEDVGVDDTCALGVQNLQQVFDAQCQQRVLRYVSGDGQAGRPGQALAGGLIVGVEDGFGRPRPGVQVNFAVEAGGGTIAPAGVTTDANGLAQVQWTLGPSLGANRAAAALVTPGAHLPLRFHAMAVRYLVLRLVGGDGQEGAPNSQLPCRLAIGVEDETGRPQAAAQVTFTTDSGTVTQADNAANQGSTITVSSGATGLAEVLWILGAVDGCHHVLATLAGPPQQTALPVRFQAMARTSIEAPGRFPRIERINWRHDHPLGLTVFNSGLSVAFSEAMSEATATPETFIVTLELPHPEELPAAALGRYAGYHSLIMHGRVTVEAFQEDGTTKSRWRFDPTLTISPQLLAFWTSQEPALFHSTPRPVRCRVVLKSPAILDAAGRRSLDGNAFSVLTDETDAGRRLTDLRLPSGDGQRGGEFESWFYLVP